MNNIKFLVNIFLCMSLFSCNKSVEISGTLNKIVINKTDQHIINIMVTDAGSDSLFSKGFDSLKISFVKKSMSESVLFGLAYTRPPEVSVNDDILYNLTDTSSFNLMADYNDIYNYSTWMRNKNDSIYYNHLHFGSNESTDLHTVISVKLYLTDSILRIMQKDYSMLEKFKDYYSK